MCNEVFSRDILYDNINILLQNPVTISQQIAYGISWHQKLPALAVGGDQKVHIYMLDYV